MDVGKEIRHPIASNVATTTRQIRRYQTNLIALATVPMTTVTTTLETTCVCHVPKNASTATVHQNMTTTVRCVRLIISESTSFRIMTGQKKTWEITRLTRYVFEL